MQPEESRALTRLYCKAIGFKTAWMVLEQKQKCGSMEQDRSLEINPHTYNHLI